MLFLEPVISMVSVQAKQKHPPCSCFFQEANLRNKHPGIAINPNETSKHSCHNSALSDVSQISHSPERRGQQIEIRDNGPLYFAPKEVPWWSLGYKKALYLIAYAFHNDLSFLRNILLQHAVICVSAGNVNTTRTNFRLCTDLQRKWNRATSSALSKVA